jgi:hypothetical protein
MDNKAKSPKQAPPKPPQRPKSPDLQGEGNRTADRNYRKAATRHAASADVEREARDAEQALEGDEHDELEDAEAKGKARARAQGSREI